MKQLLLSLIFLVASLVSFAHDFEVDGIYYNLLSKTDWTCEVTHSFDGQVKYTGEVIIPEQVHYAGKILSVVGIGNYAFSSCSSLTSVSIGKSVTSIGDYAFQNCSKLTSITLPNSVTSVGDMAFYNSKLTSVTIPSSVTSIGERAFYYCPWNLQTFIEIEDIGSWCNNTINKNLDGYRHLMLDGVELTSIIIPDTVTSIEADAFKGCSSLNSVIIPNSVKSIEDLAFHGCKSLTSITIGKSAKNIKRRAFYGCSSLNEIVSLSATPPACGTETFIGVSITTCVVKVPESSIIQYEVATSWKDFWNIVAIDETGITSIEMKKALLLHSNGNTITVDGLEDGEILELYNVNGMMLDKVTSSGTSVTLGNGLQKHQIYIIKAGDRSIKYKF